MSDSAKVVRLDVDIERVLKARLSRLPSEIIAVHEKSKLLLADNLKTFFDRLDDSLFELADKAQNHQDQDVYFAAMRELRIQRRSMERQFFVGLDEAFVRLEGAQTGAVAAGLNAETLSLVQNDELEQQMAMEAMLAQAHRRHAEPLGQISFRLDSLVPFKVYAKNNPVGPDVICAALGAACARLDLSVRVRLLVLKIFDKQVLAELTAFYRAINQLLIDLKVVPSLREMSTNSAASTGAPLQDQRGLQGRVEPQAGLSSGFAGGARTGSSGATSSFDDELAQLLSEMVRGVSAPMASVLTAQTLPLAALVDVLSRAQRQAGGTSSGIADVHSLVDALGNQRGYAAQLSRMDSELINLVSLLFEYILNDRNLAAPIKQLISRLQIPIVKVALVDKSFFTQNGHVARRLLNELALAGVGWSGSFEDSLYRRIESVVQRIVDDFEADTGLFGELLVEFSSFIEREKRRAALFERRVLDAEDGKAKADAARNKVNTEVGLRTLGFALPADIERFIQGPWNSVLFLVGLKQGLDSQAWCEHLQTLTDLVWSLQPPRSPVERLALIKLVPRLLTRLRTGLDLIAFNPFEMARFFGHLEVLHMASISAYAPQYVGPPKVEEPALVVPVAPVAPVAPDEVSISATDLHWQQVASFAPGSWFDFLEPNTPALRCRLAAVIRQTGNFIFVNRSGVKVTEKSHHDLALALRSGKLRPLDSSMLFDRALEEVVSGLRKTSNLSWDLGGGNKKS